MTEKIVDLDIKPHYKQANFYLDIFHTFKLVKYIPKVWVNYFESIEKYKVYHKTVLNAISILAEIIYFSLLLKAACK